MKNLFIQIFALSVLLLALSSCSASDEFDRADGNYYALSFHTMRSHGSDSENPSMTPPGTDTELNEDKVAELRLIIFLHGGNISVFNHKFEPSEMPQNTVKFFVEREGQYDLFLIANESAANDNVSGQASTELSFLSDPSVSRSKLLAAKGNAVNIHLNQMGSGSNGLLLMTAVYENVRLDRVGAGSGSEANPFKLDLTSQNLDQRPGLNGLNGKRSAAELMRAMAKVEVLLRGVIEVDYTNGKESPQYHWILPYGFSDDSYIEVSLVNMPITYRLLPKSSETNTDAPLVVDTGYKFSTSAGSKKPDPKQVVKPEGYSDSDDPIGGLEPLDYSVYFYVPECLFSSTLELKKENQPAVKVSYKRAGPTKPEEKIYTEEKIYPIENGSTTSQYEWIIKPIYNNGVVRPDYNIYRNKHYRMRLNITGKSFEWLN